VKKDDVQYVGSRLQETMSMEFAWYLTGFVDGEDCFSISFTKREKLKTGIEVRPSFSIGQNKRSLPVLERAKAYFGCGAIRFSRRDQMYKYETRSIGEIRKRIIPHFKKYPLQTSKLNDFATFAWICDEIAASRHLNRGSLAVIIDRAYTMNESGKRRYTKEQLLKIIEAR
jgi:hypothetical protein